MRRCALGAGGTLHLPGLGLPLRRTLRRARCLVRLLLAWTPGLRRLAGLTRRGPARGGTTLRGLRRTCLAGTGLTRLLTGLLTGAGLLGLTGLLGLAGPALAGPALGGPPLARLRRCRTSCGGTALGRACGHRLALLRGLTGCDRGTCLPRLLRGRTRLPRLASRSLLALPGLALPGLALTGAARLRRTRLGGGLPCRCLRPGGPLRLRLPCGA